MYIAQCQVNFHNHVGLIQLARAFGIKCLDDLVCRFIENRLEKYEKNEKASRLYELINFAKVAYSYGLREDIKSRCIDLLSSSRNEIIQTEEWDKFANEFPSIVADMLTR